MITRGIRRAPWLDARLLLGGGLVVASVAGVVTLVSAADTSVVVYAAARPLSVGERLETSDLEIAEVRLGAAEARYVRAEALPEDGAVVLRAVDRGELVPLAALGDATSTDMASVVIETTSLLPRDVEPGMGVDVWSSAPTDAGSFAAPTVLVADAVVVRTIDDTGFGSSGAAVAVELLVPRNDIAEVLSAVANAHALSLVPVGSAIGGTR